MNPVTPFKSEQYEKKIFVHFRNAPMQRPEENDSVSQIMTAVTLFISGIGIGALLANYFQSPCPYEPPGWPYVSKAPLTLVRSEKPEQLTISLHFEEPKMSPVEPIEPRPTHIEACSSRKTYTWNVQTDGSGLMDAKGLNGLMKRIQMIWWESIRKENKPVRPDPAQSVCIRREDLKNFLESTLKNSGVSKKESEAFVHYWVNVFQNKYDPVNAPYLRVQLVKPEELDRFVPKMSVESKTPFELKRFYFLFEPVAKMAEKGFLVVSQPQTIGKNAVLDLGGEVAAEEISNGKWDESAFNRAFIKKYIYA